MTPATPSGDTPPVGGLPVGTPPITTLPVGTPPGTIIAGSGTIIGGIGTFTIFSTTTLSTAKTSMTLPPDLLLSGKTYLFVITSVVDGKANMETSPHRSLLPVANAQLISAPITVQ